MSVRLTQITVMQMAYVQIVLAVLIVRATLSSVVMESSALVSKFFLYDQGR